jgi:hypothetical protein
MAVTGCGSSTTSSNHSTAVSARGAFLAYSDCMRTHGVPSFPDPGAGGGIRITPSSAVDPRSPAFQGAQRRCQNLLPGGGPRRARPSDGPRLLRLAECMRAHGVTSFPDPTPAGSDGLPSSAAALVIDGYEFKLGPGTDPMSPAFQNAMKACGGPGPPGGPHGG